MQNVKYEVKGDKLIIEINLKEELGTSKSGKTTMIATTGGNADIGKDGVKFGLNVYKPLKAAKK